MIGSPQTPDQLQQRATAAERRGWAHAVAFWTQSLPKASRGRQRGDDAVLGSAASNRVNERCRVTAATSASISVVCGATAATRSRRSNAASGDRSVLLVHARTKTTVLGRPWAFPGPAIGKRSRPPDARIFRQPRRYACNIFVDRPLRVSSRYFRQNTARAPAPQKLRLRWATFPSLRALLP